MRSISRLVASHGADQALMLTQRKGLMAWNGICWRMLWRDYDVSNRSHVVLDTSNGDRGWRGMQVSCWASPRFRSPAPDRSDKWLLLLSQFCPSPTCLPCQLRQSVLCRASGEQVITKDVCLLNAIFTSSMTTDMYMNAILNDIYILSVTRDCTIKCQPESYLPHQLQQQKCIKEPSLE